MDIILKKLINTFGVSGNEQLIKNIIKEELKDSLCEINEDKVGNLIVKIGQGKEKIMFGCSMDQIGFIVSNVEDTGFIRVNKVGNFKEDNVIHNFVRFKNGVLGKISINKEILFIDIGIKDKDKVLEKVKVGDMACLVGPYLEVGEGSIISPNLNSRISCYVLIRLIKEFINNVNKEIYFVFGTQGELKGKGLRFAAYDINPDYCVLLDSEETDDLIGKKGNIKLGEGPILKIMDKVLIMHHEIKKAVQKSAENSKIKLQYYVSNSKSNGGIIHKEREGIKTGEVCIPCRYKYSSSEMISMKDIENVILLFKGLFK